MPHDNIDVYVTYFPILLKKISIVSSLRAQASCGRPNQLRKQTFRSSAGPRFACSWLRVDGAASFNPTPFPTELTWKYNSMFTYILVSFLSGFVFFQKLCSG